MAIDIAAAHSHYWLRANLGAGGHIAYRNGIPWEIIRIFEAHGFIWGGK
ncbi:MAG: M15 family metallopeptidase [Pseudolabrys sp.]